MPWTIGLVLLLACLAAVAAHPAGISYRRPPVLTPAPGAAFDLGGVVGDRLRVCREQWLLPAPDANPAMLEMFRDRDRPPYRDLLPWSGEFVGKYLTAAVLNQRTAPNAALRRRIEQVARDFIATQSPEGYLGPFHQDQRLQHGWDLWGHYHALVGLLLYWDDTHDETALQACRRAGDFICATFPEGGKRVVSVGDQEMNEAIIHGLLMLYRRTAEPRYLAMAQRVEQDWEVPPSGDYVRTALAGLPFYQTPKPRWESLHDLEAIAELYWLTGDTRYRAAFEHIWWSIAEGDRHNTGGFSSGEQAQGNPYHQGAIETCCTVAWVALSTDMLRLTGSSVVADEIELSTYNGGLGGQHPSGRWWTYNTPMDGERRASAHDINFQCRPGSPELNCCSVNGPRLLGMVSEWGLMAGKQGLVLNHYGPGTMAAEVEVLGSPSPQPSPLGRGRRGRPAWRTKVTLTQRTRYPREGRVEITVGVPSPAPFALSLRIPYWSAETKVAVNGQAVPAKPGSYLRLERTWCDSDEIIVSLDLRPHFWVGERECAGRVSIFRGPLLLAYDRRFNDTPFEELAPLAADKLDLQAAPRPGSPAPWLLLRATAADGRPVYLCDFASAGMAGTTYHSWLPVSGVQATAFSRQNPLRSSRPAGRP